MKITILALGSRGDTQPCIALAAGLNARGHEVTLLASPRYGEVIERAGVRSQHISFDPQQLAESPEGQALLASGPVGFMRGIRAVIEPIAERLLHEMDAACAQTQLVLAPTMGGIGRHLAERHGLPHAVIEFQPSEPTGAFPNPILAYGSLSAPVNRASFALIEAATWLVLQGMINRLRARVLGLGPLRRSSFHHDRAERVPVYCAVSPSVVPRPADWPANVHLTGFWLPQAGALDLAVERFLDDGPEPVYVGFGSMVPADPQQVADQVRRALRRVGVRAVVQGLAPWPSDRSTLFLSGPVDHAALFPRVSAAVHHGGAGTTATALHAGAPSVVCPFFGDQPYWGAQVHRLGVGTAPLPIKRLDAEELAVRISRAVADPTIRRRTRAIASLMQSEDGVANACAAIERDFCQARQRGAPVV